MLKKRHLRPRLRSLGIHSSVYLFFFFLIFFICFFTFLGFRFFFFLGGRLFISRNKRNKKDMEKRFQKQSSVDSRLAEERKHSPGLCCRFGLCLCSSAMYHTGTTDLPNEMTELGAYFLRFVWLLIHFWVGCLVFYYLYIYVCVCVYFLFLIFFLSVSLFFTLISTKG